jgi:antitoxin MazE
VPGEGDSRGPFLNVEIYRKTRAKSTQKWSRKFLCYGDLKRLLVLGWSVIWNLISHEPERVLSSVFLPGELSRASFFFDVTNHAVVSALAFSLEWQDQTMTDSRIYRPSDYIVYTKDPRGNSMKTRIVQIGNSRGVRIPKPLLEQSGLPDEVELYAEPGRIVLAPAREPRAGWALAAQQLREAGEDGLLETPAPRFDEQEWEWR